MKKMGIAFLAAMSLASFGCKKGGSGAMAKMEEFKGQMCKCTDKACADKINGELDKATDSKEKPSEEDMKKGEELAKKYGECMQKAMGMGGDKKPDDKMAGDKKPDEGGDKKPDDKMAGGGDGDMPKECADYMKAIEDMGKCDKMGAARDSMKQAADAMKQGFANWGSLPADAKKQAMDAAAQGCKQAADGVAQALKAAGC